MALRVMMAFIFGGEDTCYPEVVVRHTMHVSYAMGEITITPFDFSMITGLPFPEREVQFGGDLKWDIADTFD